MSFQFFEVGGAVRDQLLRVDSKDVDFVAVANNPEQFDSATQAFNSLHSFVESSGFRVFLSTPQFLTLRAQVPDNSPLSQRTTVADFVLARKDGPSSDGRRPDFVLPGTLHDDLSRRDFTVNAMARCPQSGDLVDPFGGVDDLQDRTLRFVGHPEERIAEDGLRLLRALRFSVTKGFTLHSSTLDVFNSLEECGRFSEVLSSVSVERVREEMVKMFRHDTMKTLQTLQEFPTLTEHLFSEVRLMPTLKQF
jgi:tRNA nucleotidyltransferase/poly(A) polymerase